MPPYLLDNHVSDFSLPPVPEWGSLPLDIYLLEEWDAPHPESSGETHDQRRRRLVRQFLALGTLARQPYYRRADPNSSNYSVRRPSQSQIDTILRPLRSDTLRRFALWASRDEGLWIRTCYDQELEQQHQSLWHEFVERREAIDVDSMVLDDPGLFGSDWRGVLEALPERVTNSCDVDDLEKQRNTLAKIQAEEDEPSDSEEARKSARELYAELGPQQFQQEMCRNYLQYHVDCIVTHAFVEDKKTLKGDGVLHVYLDDRGNVVRQLREDSDSADSFDAKWTGGYYDEGSFARAEIGPAYLPGGAFGPPYGQSPGPHWVQLSVK